MSTLQSFGNESAHARRGWGGTKDICWYGASRPDAAFHDFPNQPVFCKTSERAVDSSPSSSSILSHHMPHYRSRILTHLAFSSSLCLKDIGNWNPEIRYVKIWQEIILDVFRPDKENLKGRSGCRLRVACWSRWHIGWGGQQKKYWDLYNQMVWRGHRTGLKLLTQFLIMPITDVVDIF